MYLSSLLQMQGLDKLTRTQLPLGHTPSLPISPAPLCLSFSVQADHWESQFHYLFPPSTSKPPFSFSSPKCSPTALCTAKSVQCGIPALPWLCTPKQDFSLLLHHLLLMLSPFISPKTLCQDTHQEVPLAATVCTGICSLPGPLPSR